MRESGARWGAPVTPAGFGGGDGPGPGSQRRASFTGLWVLLAAVVMFFAAFTSAYIVRRGLSNDWGRTPLPPVLWVNTAVLATSSLALELARRSLRKGRRSAFSLFWTAGTVLGLLFLGGQCLAWNQLTGAGIYVSSNPASSFFYLLTAAHGLHLTGGVVTLVYVNIQALRLRLGPAKRTTADVAAYYWHFMDGLWLYLLGLFFFWG